MTYAIRPDVSAAVTDLYGTSMPETVFLAEDGCNGLSSTFDTAISVAKTALDNTHKTVSPIDFAAAQITLAQLDSFDDLVVTPEVFMSVVEGIIKSGFTRQEAVSLIGSYTTLRRSHDPPVEDSVTQSSMSERSIRRMNYRNACRSKHEEPGYCYLIPVAWKDRNDLAELLGENPTVEQVFNAYSDNFSALRDWTSYYVIKISSDDGGKYHLTKNSHQSIGTLAGLVNGLKTRWAASGSSLEKFSDLPRTVGHTEFVIPLRARIGYTDHSDNSLVQSNGSALVQTSDPVLDDSRVHVIPGSNVRTFDSDLVDASHSIATPPMDSVVTHGQNNSFLSVAHYGDFKTYTFCVDDQVFGYNFTRFLSTIDRVEFVENVFVDQLLDNLFAIADSIVNYRAPVGKQWLINCDAALYAALSEIFNGHVDGQLDSSSIKILRAIVYSLRDTYTGIAESDDTWFLSGIGVVVFSKFLSE